MEQTENLYGLRQAATARLLQAWVHSDIANGSRASEVRSALHENHHNVHLFNLHQDAIDCEHSLVLHPRITVEWYKHCCFIDALRFLGAKVRYTRDGPFHVLSHGIRTLGRNDNIWDFIHECKHHHLVIRRVSIVPLRLLAKALFAYDTTGCPCEYIELRANGRRLATTCLRLWAKFSAKSHCPIYARQARQRLLTSPTTLPFRVVSIGLYG